eukprot:m.42529 g.42529  ORF g.42529 m.42529 type:complete len:410 (-) comp10704_c0_seq1:796-2025(-)
MAFRPQGGMVRGPPMMHGGPPPGHMSHMMQGPHQGVPSQHPMHSGYPGMQGMQQVPPSQSMGSPVQVDDSVVGLVTDLIGPDTREEAMNRLSKKRDSVPDLAPLLWNSFGTISVLIHEIVRIYPMLHAGALDGKTSNRACNALALLQCTASHQDTRQDFLAAHIPLFLYPLLATTSKERPYEYLRLTSLGVIGALVKTDKSDVVEFLLSTEIIPYCLRIMETGTELSRTVATFILQKILQDPKGLAYICATLDRFRHVSFILSKMVQQLAKNPSVRLMKHVVKCFVRLSENERAAMALQSNLPVQLRDGTFNKHLEVGCQCACLVNCSCLWLILASLGVGVHLCFIFYLMAELVAVLDKLIVAGVVVIYHVLLMIKILGGSSNSTSLAPAVAERSACSPTNAPCNPIDF